MELVFDVVIVALVVYVVCLLADAHKPTQWDEWWDREE